MRIDELIERARNWAGGQVRKHQAADLGGVVRNLRPSRIVVMGQAIDLTHHGRDRLYATERGIGQHVALKILDRLHCLRLLDPTLCGGARDDVQLLRTWEKSVDGGGGAV